MMGMEWERGGVGKEGENREKGVGEERWYIGNGWREDKVIMLLQAEMVSNLLAGVWNF